MTQQTILSSLIAACVALLAVWVFAPTSERASKPQAEKETAYERVMRTGVLKCGYYQWPGVMTKNPNTGELTGMLPQMMDVVGQMLDLKIEFVEMAGLGQQIEELKRGVYDATAVESYYMFTMGKYVDFGTPYAYFPMFPYTRADETRFTQLPDLNNPNVTFVGIDGDLSVTLVSYRFPAAKLMTLPATSDASTMAVNIATKKADVGIIDPGLAATYNAHNDVKLKAIDPDHPVGIYPVGFSVKKGEDELLRMLDSAVSAMIHMGMMEPILETYRSTGGVAWSSARTYEPGDLKN